MAKKQDKEEIFNPEAELGAFFQAQTDAAAKIMGRHNVFVGDEGDRRKYGLPLPSLALQYLVGSDVFFMEQLMLIAGAPKSHKSSFGFEMARWAIQHGGFARLFDTELKKSPTLSKNLLGPCQSWQWSEYQCDTMDAWQKTFTMVVEGYREQWKIGKALKRGEKRPPLMPAVLLIDSLTGSATEDLVESFHKAGGKATNTQGMRNAKAISDFLQIQKFTYLPFHVIVIRHEKEGGMDGQSFMAAKKKQTPGGAAPDFYGGYDFRFAVIDNHRGEESGWNLVQMRCNKNAFGVDKRRVAIRFSWRWMDMGDNKVEQVPRWEWDLATAQFLADFDKADIKDICHVVQGGTKNNPIFNCKQLGLREVTGDELGMALRQPENAELYTSLQNYLHIERYTKFNSEMEIPDGK